MSTFNGTINSTGRVTDTQARTLSTYTSLGWSPGRWTTNGDTTYPQLIPNGYDVFEGTTQATTISEEQAKQRSTYESIGWDFTEIWKINEGQSYPYLWNEQIDPQPSDKIFGYIKLNNELKQIKKIIIKVNGELKNINKIKANAVN